MELPSIEMTETIYNLVPQVPVVTSKPPMYKSRHSPGCALAGSTFGEGEVEALHVAKHERAYPRKRVRGNP